jgi:hypothetical protein
MILPGFGVDAQERLAGSRALVVGCGALGCAAVDEALGATIAGPVMVGLVNNRVMVHPLEEVTSHSPRLIRADDELLRVSDSLLVQSDQPF